MDLSVDALLQERVDTTKLRAHVCWSKLRERLQSHNIVKHWAASTLKTARSERIKLSADPGSWARTMDASWIEEVRVKRPTFYLACAPVALVSPPKRGSSARMSASRAPLSPVVGNDAEGILARVRLLKHEQEEDAKKAEEAKAVEEAKASAAKAAEETAAAAMSEELMGLTVSQIKKELQKVFIDDTGTKEELVARLKAHRTWCRRYGTTGKKEELVPLAANYLNWCRDATVAASAAEPAPAPVDQLELYKQQQAAWGPPILAATDTPERQKKEVEECAIANYEIFYSLTPYNHFENSDQERETRLRQVQGSSAKVEGWARAGPTTLEAVKANAMLDDADALNEFCVLESTKHDDTAAVVDAPGVVAPVADAEEAADLAKAILESTREMHLKNAKKFVVAQAEQVANDWLGLSRPIGGYRLFPRLPHVSRLPPPSP